MPAQLTARPLPAPERVSQEAAVYRIKLPTLKVKDGSAVTMTFRYFPNKKEWPKQVVEIVKTFKDD
jgi:hypothetical protein